MAPASALVVVAPRFLYIVGNAVLVCVGIEAGALPWLCAPAELKCIAVKSCSRLLEIELPEGGHEIRCRYRTPGRIGVGQMGARRGRAAPTPATPQPPSQTPTTTSPPPPGAPAARGARVEAGAPVDEYQRGVVNYYAGVYQLGIDALRRAIAAAPDTTPRDAYLFPVSYTHLTLPTSDLV